MSYRVIQWATGKIGTESIRCIARHPELELVGLLVYNPEKAGRDAGEICGTRPLGVAATQDVDEIIAMDADCVMYMPLVADQEAGSKEICRILESGKNVVSTNGGFFMNPASQGPEQEQRFQRACERGGTSLHGTGIDPGFVGELLPLLLSGLCRNVQTVRVRECYEMKAMRKATLDYLGFGNDPDGARLPNAFLNRVSATFRGVIDLTARGMGARLEDFRVARELATATREVELTHATIAPGTIAGQRWRFEGVCAGRPAIQMEMVWWVQDGLGEDWPDSSGWTIELEGEPQFRCALTTGPRHDQELWIATAAHAVNAVPFVCDAPVGVRTFLDLPVIRASSAFAGERA